MRDRTASRNYSPAGEQFRREHQRHRCWGLTQRHAERLRRSRGGDRDPRTPTAAGNHPESPAHSAPSPFVSSTATPPDHATRPAACSELPASQNRSHRGKNTTDQTDPLGKGLSESAGKASPRRVGKASARPAGNPPCPAGDALSCPAETRCRAWGETLSRAWGKRIVVPGGKRTVAVRPTTTIKTGAAATDRARRNTPIPANPDTPARPGQEPSRIRQRRTTTHRACQSKPGTTVATTTATYPPDPRTPSHDQQRQATTSNDRARAGPGQRQRARQVADSRNSW